MDELTREERKVYHLAHLLIAEILDDAPGQKARIKETAFRVYEASLDIIPEDILDD